MCAERVYFHCHRMLVSNWLTAHGNQVLHIDGVGPATPHKLLSEARVIDGELIYRGDRLFSGIVLIGRPWLFGSHVQLPAKSIPLSSVVAFRPRRTCAFDFG